MDKLWSPWRSKYIESFKPGGEKEGCLFCRIAKENRDKENFVIHRGKSAYIVMNLYPYNSGHLMIVPYTHVPALKDLDDETKLECMKLIDLGIEALEKSIYPQGYNIGVNIGKCSGAGIDEHVHFHIVPRWSGDTNFMPVLNDVKLVSQAMEDTYGKLQAALEKIIGK
jgi:ATP adenylyltransferase